MSSISLPAIFERQLASLLGDEFGIFQESFLKPPPVSIRINPGKTQERPLYKNVPWCDTGFYLPERPSFTLDPLFHGGQYYVQEASSMFLEQAILQSIDIAPPLRVLDLCAAPGGKSTHLLSLLAQDSLLVSNEVIRSRASILAENVQKWGHPNVIVTNNDPKHFTSLEGMFDVILVDAPCSGEGLFRKDAAAATEWSPENVVLCSRRQKRILEDVWPALKKDGILIYSTCTYNRQENEENLIWLKSNNDVEFLSLQVKPEWNVTPVNEDGIKGYRLYPHRVEGEGFFLSVIKKKEDAREQKIKSAKKLTPAPARVAERIKSMINPTQDFLFFVHGDVIHALSSSNYAFSEFLCSQLRIIEAGTKIAAVKHEKVIPDHALALSTMLNIDHFEVLSVNRQEAIQYLRKEPLQMSYTGKGFALIMYNRLPIGWVNLLPGRINNLYPSHWRIRMTDNKSEFT